MGMLEIEEEWEEAGKRSKFKIHGWTHYAQIHRNAIVPVHRAKQLSKPATYRTGLPERPILEETQGAMSSDQRRNESIYDSMAEKS